MWIHTLITDHLSWIRIKEKQLEKICSRSDCWLVDSGDWRLFVHQNGHDAGGYGVGAAADGREDRPHGAARAHGEGPGAAVSCPGGRGQPDAGRACLCRELRLLPWLCRRESQLRGQRHVPAAATAPLR